MKISLCMIVKNEEKYITMCLENAINLVDEVILVDTGSEDNTIKLAQSFGDKVKVFNYKWNDNFSEARNFSLEKATGDWILMLDADEKIICDIEKFKDIISKSEKDGYIIPLYNIVGNGGFDYSEVYIKIFKNTGHRYKGAIHEQLDIEFNTIEAINQSICKIIHYGYMSSQLEAKDKTKRNLSILMREYKKNPSDPFISYNLGSTYFVDHKYSKALKYFFISNKILKDKFANSAFFYEKDMMSRISQCLLEMKEYDNCIIFLENLLSEEDYINYTDLYYFLGECYFKKKNFQNAIKNYKRCILIGERRDYISRQGIGSYIPLLKIAEIYAKQNKVMEATRYYMEAIFNPNNVAKQGLNQARTYLKENKLLEILDELNNLVS